MGLTKMEDCALCASGSYCASVGLVSVSGPCKAGYYCPSGSISELGSTPSNGTAKRCPAGYSCAVQSSLPIICPAGTFCPTGSSKATACALGKFALSPGTAVCSDCTAGYYCGNVNGTINATPCPVGTSCASGRFVCWFARVFLRCLFAFIDIVCHTTV